MTRAYYNDNDPFAAEWQGNLLDAGLAMPGTVDPRDISLVAAADLAGYTQCHFFAGILGWPMALRLARWPESREVWTASLPCQPFSSAGKRLGEKDERHLWPVFYGLVRQCGADYRPVLGDGLLRRLRGWRQGRCTGDFSGA